LADQGSYILSQSGRFLDVKGLYREEGRRTESLVRKWNVKQWRGKKDAVF
jgi:hypothetical protein